jgi:DNA-binding response OmpR family regulator
MPGTKRILVVEDDSQSASLLSACLTADGYEVCHAPDGLSALVAFDEVRPDLVTLDLMLPRVTGFRLIELLKQHHPQVPIVVISGLAFEEAEEIAHHRVNDYLPKPFAIEQLLTCVRYHLQRLAPASRPSPAASPRGLVAV